MESIWTKQTALKEREQLHQDIAVQTAVIGGGMAGILTACFLLEKGIETVVLEADRVGNGQTKNTTAKITLQHGAVCHKLIEKFGEEQAGMYARANKLAIEEYERLVKEWNVVCGFRRAPAYLYAKQERELVEKEAEAAKLLGIGAKLTTDTELPFPVASALKLEGQACFHPLEFLKAAAERVTVYEKTQVIAIEEMDGKTVLLCEQGARVTADCVVVATHYPFFNVPGYYFMRMHQERSYVLALKRAAVMEGMYYGVEEDGLSFRNAEELLLLGGAGHRTGTNTEGGQYESLRKAAEKYYPEALEAAAWSAQDCMTLDGVPYIGTYAQSKPNWYVCTGFGKWGMTSSMVSAMLISGQITGQEPSFAPVFSPQRFRVSASAKMLMEETAEAVKGLTKRFVVPAGVKADELLPGQGKIIEWNGEKLGAYRSEDGELFFVSAKCPHLGCQLEWNPEEKSFDCPCHGSRFRYTGELIDNPAQTGIQE